MQEPHVDAANTFIIAAELVRLKDEKIIFHILLLPIRHELFSGKPTVVGGPGDPRKAAEFFDRKPVVFLGQCLVDQLVVSYF